MSKFLDAFCDYAKKINVNLIRVSEMKDGYDIETKNVLNVSPCQDVYSVAKVFTVTAIGLLEDKGLLSLDEKITDILKDEIPEGYDPLWDTSTVHSILLHRVGLPHGFLDIDCVDSNTFGIDYLAHMMKQPLKEHHGNEFVYTDGAYYMLSRVVEKRAGMSTDDFLWKELMQPLSFKEAAWSHCPLGHAMGATGLYVRSDDMIKLGALYMYDGMWKDRRIFSEEWSKKVKTRGYELNHLGYGKAYGKGGAAGQMLMVVPEENRVVAWQAFDGDGLQELIEFAGQYRD